MNPEYDDSEQTERIKENLEEFYTLETFSLQDFEDVFEDRDPFEFL